MRTDDLRLRASMPDDDFETTEVSEFVDLAWKNLGEAVPLSKDRISRTMNTVVKVAVELGFKFTDGDLRFILKRRASDIDVEYIYGLAITTGNISAAKAVEDYIGRTPFMFDDVEPPHYGYGSLNVLRGRRKRGRLALSYWFTWKDERVRVTSFRGSYLIACSYKSQELVDAESDERIRRTPGKEVVDRAAYWQTAKIRHRYKLTPLDLTLESRARKKEKEDGHGRG